MPSDDEGEPYPAAFAGGVDIDWGNALYVCRTCARVIGKLFGMMTPEGSEQLRGDYDKLSEEHAELMEEHEALKDKVRRMTDGARARKEAKKAVAA
jgi:hypothetical protein